ncbi:UNVERIFIED_CONTAM: hypothetical protein Slati_3843700 [Sesamum latifolium]|uniref:Uncharacterized protein n=1 Tax=Sesamum latifolium TaxID=2727402 RepID=A0AAW2TK28_9LAMI
MGIRTGFGPKPNKARVRAFCQHVHNFFLFKPPQNSNAIHQYSAPLRLGTEEQHNFHANSCTFGATRVLQMKFQHESPEDETEPLRDEHDATCKEQATR